MTNSVFIFPNNLYREADRARQLDQELINKVNVSIEDKIILQEKETESLRKQIEVAKAQLGNSKWLYLIVHCYICSD